MLQVIGSRTQLLEICFNKIANVSKQLGICFHNITCYFPVKRFTRIANFQISVNWGKLSISINLI